MVAPTATSRPASAGSTGPRLRPHRYTAHTRYRFKEYTSPLRASGIRSAGCPRCPVSRVGRKWPHVDFLGHVHAGDPGQAGGGSSYICTARAIGQPVPVCGPPFNGWSRRFNATRRIVVQLLLRATAARSRSTTTVARLIGERFDDHPGANQAALVEVHADPLDGHRQRIEVFAGTRSNASLAPSLIDQALKCSVVEIRCGQHRHAPFSAIRGRLLGGGAAR